MENKNIINNSEEIGNKIVKFNKFNKIYGWIIISLYILLVLFMSYLAYDTLFSGNNTEQGLSVAVYLVFGAIIINGSGCLLCFALSLIGLIINVLMIKKQISTKSKNVKYIIFMIVAVLTFFIFLSLSWLV